MRHPDELVENCNELIDYVLDHPGPRQREVLDALNHLRGQIETEEELADLGRFYRTIHPKEHHDDKRISSA